MDDVYNANIRIENIDRGVMNRLGMIAAMRGRLMREIIKDAIEEFVTNHESEIPHE